MFAGREGRRWEKPSKNWLDQQRDRGHLYEVFYLSCTNGAGMGSRIFPISLGFLGWVVFYLSVIEPGQTDPQKKPPINGFLYCTNVLSLERNIRVCPYIHAYIHMHMYSAPDFLLKSCLARRNLIGPPPKGRNEDRPKW